MAYYLARFSVIEHTSLEQCKLARSLDFCQLNGYKYRCRYLIPVYVYVFVFCSLCMYVCVLLYDALCSVWNQLIWLAEQLLIRMIGDVHQVTPLSSLVEGGTPVTITGTNLGYTVSQVHVVTLAREPCTVVDDQYVISTRLLTHISILLTTDSETAYR